jgi:hypothetical protein
MKFAKEGEFWMAFDDFIKSFTKVEICHIVNTAVVSIKKSWSEAVFRGKWTAGVKGSKKDRSGGCDKHPSFLYNPQVRSFCIHRLSAPCLRHRHLVFGQ